MNTKLTLTLDSDIISEAKAYAQSKGQSLSQLVENYLKLLTGPKSETVEPKTSPKIASLQGALKLPDNFDYKQVLKEEREKKHGY